MKKSMFTNCLHNAKSFAMVLTCCTALQTVCPVSVLANDKEDTTTPSSSQEEAKPDEKVLTDRELKKIVAKELKTTVPTRPWKYIVIHHTAGTRDTIESMDALHKGKGWGGIGYDFVIGNGEAMKDGEIKATYRWKEQRDGAHAGNREYNVHGIGVCLVGNFENTKPTEAQVKSLRALVHTLQKQFRIEDESLRRHGDVRATACPGKNFSMELITKKDSE